jgi:hypothetical protein
MENYRVIRCSVEVYIPIDNIENNCMPEDDLEDFVIHDIDKAMHNQVENESSVMYQSNYIVDIDD